MQRPLRIKKNAPIAAGRSCQTQASRDLKTGGEVSHDAPPMGQIGPQRGFSPSSRRYPRPSRDSRALALLAAEDAELRALWRSQPYVTPPSWAADLNRITRLMAGVSTDTQLNRLATALRMGPVTTFEVRKHLAIPAVSARICDLRYYRGMNIVRKTVLQAGELGHTHLIAQYVLIEENQP